jgi:hypothetical protein
MLSAQLLIFPAFSASTSSHKLNLNNLLTLMHIADGRTRSAPPVHVSSSNFFRSEIRGGPVGQIVDTPRRVPVAFSEVVWVQPEGTTGSSTRALKISSSQAFSDITKSE